MNPKIILLGNGKTKYAKTPIERDWPNNYYDENDIKVRSHKGNKGIILGDGLIVVDTDTEKLTKVCDEKLPPTFKVKTSKGFHYYFYCDEVRKKIVLKKGKHHYGEILSNGNFCVAPNSIHQSGLKYKVVSEEPIAKISFEELYEVIRNFVDIYEKSDNELKHELNIPGDINSIPLTSIINASGWKDKGEEMQGSNPWHGSDTGMNTTINVSKNVGYCFRCDAAITVAKAIGLNEGIITNCSDYLSKDQFIEVLKIAQDKYGLLEKHEYIKAQPKRKIKILWFDELKNIKAKEVEWLVKDLIPKKSITFLAGKRSTYKSFFSLSLGLSIASGTSAFDIFPCTKTNVLYLDEENGEQIIKARTDMIVKGSNLSPEEKHNLGFVSFQNVKLDKKDWIDELKEIIKENKIELIIVDSYRRFVAGDENKAEIVNDLFTDIIRPLTEELGVSWIFLHHLRKGIAGKNPEDILDELRGSSDLANYADGVLVLQRNRGATDSFIMRQPKLRYAAEIDAKVMQLEWNDDSLNIKCVGNAQDSLVADEICAKDILKWMAENQITKFKRVDLNEPFSKESKATVDRAVRLLKESGKLISPKRGYYELAPSVKLEEFEVKEESVL